MLQNLVNMFPVNTTNICGSGRALIQPMCFYLDNTPSRSTDFLVLGSREKGSESTLFRWVGAAIYFFFHVAPIPFRLARAHSRNACKMLATPRHVFLRFLSLSRWSLPRKDQEVSRYHHMRSLLQSRLSSKPSYSSKDVHRMHVCACTPGRRAFSICSSPSLFALVQVLPGYAPTLLFPIPEDYIASSTCQSNEDSVA